MMARELNVLVDVSGSMAEDCKNAVVRYLIHTILSQTKCVKKNIYLLGNTIEKVDDSENLKINYGGQISVSAVNQLFASGMNDAPVLLLSDGCFDVEIENALSKHQNKIVCVAVGSDALLHNLQRCSKNKKVYQNK